VKLAAFVPLGASQVILGFPSAVLTEVLGGLGYNIGEELELNSSETLS